MGLPNYIEGESKYLGYRVARGDDACIENAKDLKTALELQSIDVLKLNLSNTSKEMYLQLDALNCPYYVLGIMLQYKAIFNHQQPFVYENEEIEFEPYNREDEGAFCSMVADIFRNAESSYYHNPGLLGKVTQEQQLNCLVQYINTLNESCIPNNYTHLLKLKGKTVGFICSYKDGRGGAATYSGVLPPYQNQGLYLDMIRFIHNYGKSIGQQWGTSTVQLHNVLVQRSFQKMGMQPNGYVLNVHVNSFFGNLKP